MRLPPISTGLARHACSIPDDSPPSATDGNLLCILRPIYPSKEELPLMFSVLISEKGGQQSRLDFDKTEITIGRMKGNDIVLPKGNVSKQHTRIVLRDSAFFIVDLKSTNGTYVNGRKVTAEQAVSETDKIYIGDFILQMEHPNAGMNAGPPQPPQAPGRGFGGAPPQPPQAPGGGRPMDRHFPTVMDGPQGGGFGGGQAQSGPQQPMNPPSAPHPSAPHPSAPLPSGPQPSGPQAMPPRAPSFPGSPMASPTPTPPPGGAIGNDLRQPHADMGVYPIHDEVLEVAPEVEPMTEDDRVTGDGPSYDAGIEEIDPFDVAATPTPVPQAAPAMPLPEVTPELPELTPELPEVSPQPPAPSMDAPLLEAPAPLFHPEDDVIETPGALGIRPLAARISLEDEFDAELHLAQVDVARVFFEQLDDEALPLSYPPEEDDRSRFENMIDEAVEAVSPQGDRDAFVERMLTEAVGLGPVEGYLDDPEVQAIYVNRYDRIILRRAGKLVIAPQAYSHPDFLTVAARRLLGPQ